MDTSLCMSPMKGEQKNAVHFHARWDMAVQRFEYFVLVCGGEEYRQASMSIYKINSINANRSCKSLLLRLSYFAVFQIGYCVT